MNKVVSIIRELCNDVEMIILFGSYARGDWKEETDLEPERKSGHTSDYDVLVVVKEKSTASDTAIWHEIAKKCRNLNLSTHVRIIAHDIQYLNIQLAEGQYFFTDIKREGRLLYDAENLTLAGKRKLKPDEKQRIARDYYDHWFERANRFYRHFEVDLQEKDFKGASFQLHQTAEACYKTILLVCTGYNPNEHYLALLGLMAAEHHPDLALIFPKQTDTERESFQLLDYAYIGARYDPEYRIAQEQLEYLAERVRMLLELTENICKAMIGR